MHGALHRIREKLCGAGQKDDTIKASGRGQLEELDKMLLKEGEEFQVSHLSFCLLLNGFSYLFLSSNSLKVSAPIHALSSKNVISSTKSFFSSQLEFPPHPAPFFASWLLTSVTFSAISTESSV